MATSKAKSSFLIFLALSSFFSCLVQPTGILLGVEAYKISFSSLQNKRILVVGGSGRVGGSVVTQLTQRGAVVTVGGTNVQSFEKSRARWIKLFPNKVNELSQVRFVQLDREKADTLRKNNFNFDLVVHTAGPFQGKVNAPNGVLEACVTESVPYIDVCDDYCTASMAKTKFSQLAIDNKVPCIVSTGCWPGVSSLMAKQLTRKVIQEKSELKPEDLTVEFGFFTSGYGRLSCLE